MRKYYLQILEIKKPGIPHRLKSLVFLIDEYLLDGEFINKEHDVKMVKKQVTFIIMGGHTGH